MFYRLEPRAPGPVHLLIHAGAGALCAGSPGDDQRPSGQWGE